MKTALALLVIFNIIIGLALLAFLMAYSVVETDAGGEYLILKKQQTEECRTGGGCAVFSHREFLQAVQMLRHRM